MQQADRDSPEIVHASILPVEAGLSFAKNFNRYLRRPPNNISTVVAGAHEPAVWLSLSKMPPRDLYVAFWLPSQAVAFFFSRKSVDWIGETIR